MFQGGIYILNSGRDIVSLTLNSTVRGDTGEWTCSAQVYESGTTLTVGQPVERTLQLVVVGKCGQPRTSEGTLVSKNVCRLR